MPENLAMRQIKIKGITQETIQPLQKKKKIFCFVLHLNSVQRNLEISMPKTLGFVC